MHIVLLEQQERLVDEQLALVEVQIPGTGQEGRQRNRRALLRPGPRPRLAVGLIAAGLGTCRLARLPGSCLLRHDFPQRDRTLAQDGADLSSAAGDRMSTTVPGFVRRKC
jgi:hypothetical protein